MSMTMETGELLHFHVKVGDHIKTGDILFEVMTDKIDMEVDAPADGVIESLLVNPGDMVEIGKPVLMMLTDVEIMSFEFNVDEKIVAGLSNEESPVPTDSPMPRNNSDEWGKSIRSVPKVRVEAASRGIDLRTINPTGPSNTIMMADLSLAQIDPAITKRREANRALVANWIMATRAIPQTSFHHDSHKVFDQAQLISAWAKVLRSRSDLSATECVGVALIVESKYGSALPVFKNPDMVQLDQLRILVTATSKAAKNGKVPIEMLSGATTTVFDLTSYQMGSSSPLLFPNQMTSVIVGSNKQNTKTISISINLNLCDFYDGALLLDALISNL